MNNFQNITEPNLSPIFPHHWNFQISIFEPNHIKEFLIFEAPLTNFETFFTSFFFSHRVLKLMHNPAQWGSKILKCSRDIFSQTNERVPNFDIFFTSFVFSSATELQSPCTWPARWGKKIPKFARDIFSQINRATTPQRYQIRNLLGFWAKFSDKWAWPGSFMSSSL